jgi:hypothetical protein
MKRLVPYPYAPLVRSVGSSVIFVNWLAADFLLSKAITVLLIPIVGPNWERACWPMQLLRPYATGASGLWKAFAAAGTGLLRFCAEALGARLHDLAGSTSQARIRPEIDALQQAKLRDEVAETKTHNRAIVTGEKRC